MEAIALLVIVLIWEGKYGAPQAVGRHIQRKIPKETRITPHKIISSFIIFRESKNHNLYYQDV